MAKPNPDKVTITIKIDRQGKIYEPVVDMKVTKTIPIGMSSGAIEKMISEAASNAGLDATIVYNRERFDEE